MAARARLLWSYYVVNHVLGGEKDVRAGMYGTTGGARACLYYAHSLCADHLGKVFLVLAAAGIVSALVLRRCRPTVSPSPRLAAPHLAWFFLATCLAVPYAILTVNVAKSPVVGSILVPVVLWLALWPLLTAASRPEVGRVALGGLAAVALLGGAFTQIRAATQTNLWPAATRRPRASLPSMTTLSTTASPTACANLVTWRTPSTTRLAIPPFTSSPTSAIGCC